MLVQEPLWCDLYEDLANAIFQNCSLKEKVTLSKVCKQWFKLMSLPIIGERHLKELELSIIQDQTWFQRCKSYYETPRRIIVMDVSCSMNNKRMGKTKSTNLDIAIFDICEIVKSWTDLDVFGANCLVFSSKIERQMIYSADQLCSFIVDNNMNRGTEFLAVIEKILEIQKSYLEKGNCLKTEVHMYSDFDEIFSINSALKNARENNIKFFFNRVLHEVEEVSNVLYNGLKQFFKKTIAPQTQSKTIKRRREDSLEAEFKEINCERVVKRMKIEKL